MSSEMYSPLQEALVTEPPSSGPFQQQPQRTGRGQVPVTQQVGLPVEGEGGAPTGSTPDLVRAINQVGEINPETAKETFQKLYEENLLGMMSGLPADTFSNLSDQIITDATGTKKDFGSLLLMMRDSVRAGDWDEKIGMAYAMAAFGDSSEKLRQHIAALEAADPGNPSDGWGWFGEAASGAVRMFTPNAKRIARGAAVGAASAIVLTGLAYLTGATGGAGAALAPAGALTIDAMGMWALGAGISTVGAAQGILQETGFSYREILQMKDANGNTIDPVLARTMAVSVGLLCGVLEGWQWGSVTKAFVGKEAFSQGSAWISDFVRTTMFSKAGRQVLNSKFAKIAVKAAKVFAGQVVDITSNSAQEVLQDIVHALGEAFAASISNVDTLVDQMRVSTENMGVTQGLFFKDNDAFIAAVSGEDARQNGILKQVMGEEWVARANYLTSVMSEKGFKYNWDALAPQLLDTFVSSLGSFGLTNAVGAGTRAVTKGIDFGLSSVIEAIKGDAVDAQALRESLEILDTAATNVTTTTKELFDARDESKEAEAANKTLYSMVGQDGKITPEQLKNLDVARNMEQQLGGTSKATNEKLRLATGWYRAPDKQWRYEVWDGDAVLATEKLDQVLGPGMTKKEQFALEDILDHPRLYAIYPELKSVMVTTVPAKVASGAFDTQTLSIVLKGPDTKAARRTLFHEIQHWIQEREGFKSGTSMAAETREVLGMTKLLDATTDYLTRKGLEKRLDAVVAEISAGKGTEKLYLEQEDLKRKITEIKDREAARNKEVQDEAWKRYRSNAGELEARIVAARSDKGEDFIMRENPYGKATQAEANVWKKPDAQGNLVEVPGEFIARPRVKTSEGVMQMADAQSVDTLEELFSQAEAARPQFNTIGASMAATANGTVEFASDKSIESAAAKADRMGSVRAVNDILRGTITVKETADIADAVKAIYKSEDGRAIRRVDRKNSRNDGKIETVLKVEMDNGHIGEIVVTSEKMDRAERELGSDLEQVAMSLEEIADNRRHKNDVRAAAAKDLATVQKVMKDFYAKADQVASPSAIKELASSSETVRPLRRILAAWEGSRTKTGPLGESWKILADLVESEKTEPSKATKVAPMPQSVPSKGAPINKGDLRKQISEAFTGLKGRDLDLAIKVINELAVARGLSATQWWNSVISGLKNGMPKSKAALFSFNKGAVKYAQENGFVSEKEVQVYEDVEALSSLDTTLYVSITGRTWQIEYYKEAGKLLGIARPASPKAKSNSKEDVKRQKAATKKIKDEYRAKIDAALKNDPVLRAKAENHANALVPTGRGAGTGHGYANWLELQRVLEKSPEAVAIIREIEKRNNASLLDENLKAVGIPGMASVTSMSNSLGVEYLKYPSFAINFAQLLLDNLPKKTFSDLSKKMNAAIEDAYAKMQEGKLSEEYKRALFGKNFATVASLELGLAPLRKADKTVAALNLNTFCPMYNVGNNGCYFTCYASQKAQGGSNVPGGQHALYTGQILQLSEESAAAIRKIGLRVNGEGDLTAGQFEQLKHIFKHAGMRNIPLKLITKQRDTLRMISLLQKDRDPNVRKAANDAVCQTSVDSLWTDVRSDTENPMVKGLIDSIKRGEQSKNEELVAEAKAQLIDYYKRSGREVKEAIGPDGEKTFVRKYGFTSEQVAEMAAAFPTVRQITRTVCVTDEQVAEYALHAPQVLQTWYHGAIPGSFYDQLGKRWINPYEYKNWNGRSDIYKDASGKWHIDGDRDKNKAVFNETADYIYSHYSAEDAEKIFQTLKGSLESTPSSLCCPKNASADACALCTSMCASLKPPDNALLQANAVAARKHELYAPSYRAAVVFEEDGRAIMHASRAATFRDFLHEIGHVLSRQLDQDQIDAIAGWLGEKPGTPWESWKTESHEKWAKGFTLFCETGKAPSTRLEKIFEAMRKALSTIVEALGVKLNPKVSRVYQSFFMTQQEKAQRKDALINVSDGYWKTMGYVIDMPGKNATPEQIEAAITEVKAKSEAALEKQRQAVQDATTVKGRIAAAVGITKVEEVVSETKALKAALAKAAQVSKELEKKQRDAWKNVTSLLDKAVKDQKIEDAALLKVKVQEAKDALRASIAKRKELQAQRRYWKNWSLKTAAKITRPVAKNVDVKYKLVIEQMQRIIDPKFRSKASNESLEASRQFIIDHPEHVAEMPKALMKKLVSRDLSQWTVIELDELWRKTEQLRMLGALKYKLKQAQRQKYLEETRQQFITALEGRRDRRGFKKIAGQPITEKEKVPFRKMARAETLDPQRYFDKLDGGHGTFSGPFYRFFYQKTSDLRTQELDRNDEATKSVMKRMGDAKVGLGKLMKKYDIAGKRLSLDQILYIMEARKQPEHLKALVHGSGFTDKHFEAMEPIYQKNKAAAEILTAWYKEQGPLLREAVHDLENEDMGIVDHYLPIYRIREDGKNANMFDFNANIMEEMKIRDRYRKQEPWMGWKKSRTMKGEHQLPIQIVGLYTQWFTHQQKVTEYLTYRQHLKDMYEVLGVNTGEKKAAASDKVRTLLNRKFGPQAVEYIRNYINEIGDPKRYAETGLGHELLRIARSNTAVVGLGINAMSAAVNVVQFPLYFADVGVGRYMWEVAKFAGTFGGSYRKMRAMSTQMRHRSFDRVMEEWSSVNRSFAERKRNALANRSMFLLYMADAVINSPAFMGMYNKLKPKVGHEEAVRQAENLILRVQPGGHTKDIAPMYSSDVLSSFVQFTQGLNKMYQRASYDMPSWLFRSEKGSRAKGFLKFSVGMMGLALQAYLVFSIRNGRPPRPDELDDLALDEALDYTPVIGPMLSSLREGMEPSTPMASFLKSVAQATGLTKGTKQKRIEAAFRAISWLARIPYVGIKRILDVVATGDISKLLGTRRK